MAVARVLRQAFLAALVATVFPLISKTSHAAGPHRAETVSFANEYGGGAIIVRTGERRLYYTLNREQALRYKIAVGSRANQWTGTTYVSAKRKNPGWSPTASMRRRNPRLPRHVAPGPKNPLGIRALYLDWGSYRIHGTNAPRSIGRAVSHGCIRMLNEDVADLYERVHIGAPVYVER